MGEIVVLTSSGKVAIHVVHVLLSRHGASTWVLVLKHA